MRKPTEPQTRKNNRPSSHIQTGLIANDQNRGQSAQPTSVLDNRSHRTYSRFTTPRSTAQPGAGVSDAFPCDYLSWPAAVSGQRPRNVNPAG
jgi:hypothetical protein